MNDYHAVSAFGLYVTSYVARDGIHDMLSQGPFLFTPALKSNFTQFQYNFIFIVQYHVKDKSNQLFVYE